jgi:glycosyltransferase involved in cell wall biosynthesis
MSHKLYDEAFSSIHEAGSADSAAVILGTLFKHLQPLNVVDVGCGRGTWLRRALQLGARHIVGLDGGCVDREHLLIPREAFRVVDLLQPLEIRERFDLCICLEVAEHLPFRDSERLLRDLTALSDAILFSAAVPYQGGKGHINEQWPEFWALLFRRLGYSAHDPFRRAAWLDEKVVFGCAQNALLFTRDGSPASELVPDRVAPGEYLSVAHPIALLSNIMPYRRLAGASKEDEIRDWRDLALAFASGAKSIPPLRTAKGAARCGGGTSGAATLEAPGILNREADGPLLKRRLSSASWRASGARSGSFPKRCNMVTNGDENSDCAAEVPTWHHELEDARETMAALESRCSLLEEWLKEGSTRRAVLERRLHSLERQNEKLLDRAVSSEARNADSAEILENWERRIDSLLRHNELLLERVSVSEARNVDLVETLNERQLRIADMREDIERMRAREDELSAEAAAARELKERVELLHNSTSWRLTAPLRTFMRTFLWLRSRAICVLPIKKAVSPAPAGESTQQILSDPAGPTGASLLVNISARPSIGVHPCKRILIVENRLPMPDRNSSSVRLWEMIKTMRALGEPVTFASHCGPEFYDCILGNGERELQKYVQAFEGLGVPIVFNYGYIVDYLKQYGRDYKMVILSLAEIMHEYCPAIRRYAPQAHVVYDTVDLHGLRFEREAQMKGGEELEERARRYQEMETANLRSADTVVAVTETEREAILKLAPDALVMVIPNIHEVPQVREIPLEEREGLVFIGHYLHSPNADAVEYFVRDILPLVKRLIPDVKFRMLGNSMTDEVYRLADDSVEAIGYVAEVTPYFQQSRVFVAPLRFGAGMKGKIGQSMSLGLPVVTTSIGAEGMALVNEEHVLIADDASEFADAVVRLYTDDQLWKTIARQARDLMRLNYSPTVVRGRIEALVALDPNRCGSTA